MKILFLSDVSLNNPSSGAEQVLKNQALGMFSRGFDVFAITRQNESTKTLQYRNVNGVKEACYTAIPKDIICFIYSFLRWPNVLLKAFVKKGSFCAFICHQPFTSASLLLTGKITKLPLIYVFHSPIHEEFILIKGDGTKLWNRFLAHIRKIIEGYCLKRASKIIVLSQYIKQKAIKIHKLRNDLIVVNPGGVDINRFKPVSNRKRIKDELDYSKDKIHLLTVRNLEPRMGLDNLLIGVKLLKEANIPIQLVIVGNGPEKQNLRKLIEEFKIFDDVTLAGFVTTDKLIHYYSAADFFVLPTRKLEGFGLVTPESMACGTPVLGTPVGGTKEILEKFDPQFLFSDSTPDAMATGIRRAIDVFFGDEEKYNRLRTRCRQFVVQNYSWQRHIDQLESIVVELIESKQLKN